MKVAVVMTYFERQQQLTRTLLSMQCSQHDDFEVIIVDDNSPHDIVLPELSYPVYVHKLRDKAWINPEPAYNVGLIHALRRRADVIVVQNAECMHIGDVIARAAQLTDDEYIAFACLSLSQKATKHLDENLFRIHEIAAQVHSGASCDGQTAWYNHPKYRPVGYDFCAATTRLNWLALNGYDERFSAGCGYGDDYLRQRVRMLRLRFDIPVQPFVVHQWHYNGFGVPANKADLVARNKQLFYQLLAEEQPRAKHIYTSDFESITC
jgi:glycosyltransferase involved in cell wall biosynthesis